MRKSLIAAIGGSGVFVAAALLIPSAVASPGDATAHDQAGHTAAKDTREGSVSADDLLAKVKDCDQISNGKYKPDEDGSATVPVCDADSAVFWKADLDVDCDGQETEQCNLDTDPAYQDDTAFHTSDGQPLDAAKTPYVVLPGKSDIWDYSDSGLEGGSIVAVINGDKVEYAAVGDIGPEEAIGEASYAAADALGIDPDPATGGADDGVTYIAFKNSKTDAIEDHDKTVELGDELAQDFVNGG
ncbi:chitosanase (glycosyl hydrolase group 75) [Streptomyces sp. Amel2xB2]|uniref:glycoside hydrolase family 75 protein n=1 Tax=Streptomyces sp. Amel2xB2 TaxID=1305829 RepID=UPI000DB904EA|nr:glycoside hydrolase family 75 protein [Streptomyces sp. Amel2xB2]RAJ58826.1 chitosanase (glycosyl hydrolase group 75) [Streptomyces sp. Amel2xB2]